MTDTSHDPRSDDSPVSAVSAVTSSIADAVPSWRRALVVGMAAYVVSRLCVIAGTAVRAAQLAVDARADGEPEVGACEVISQVLTSWDGKWYLEIIRGGYPSSVPANITYEQLEARAAFFPLYPWTARVLDHILPGGDTLAALLLNFVLGAISVVLVGVLARRLYGVSVAARAMTLYAVFPGSVVLSFAYSEAMLIVLAATCLILLLDERWLLAGLTAALATATRPNGIAIVAACVVASFLAIRRSREWISLVAVVLAPIGFVFFQWYVSRTAGENWIWFRVQREAWAEGTSFGTTAVSNTFQFVTNPLSSPSDALTGLTMIALIGMVYCAWKARLPWILVAFCAVVVALMLIPETVTARPRFLFTAFPFFIAVAAWWPEPADDTEQRRASWEYAGWDLTLVACGAGLAALTGLYAVFGVIP
jgi:4-amino-4-deoxy-L-arabinose transferase-like glycosyltransferase